MDADVTVAPVPTTAARRRQRGFDGCELIARLAFPSRVIAGLVQVRGETQRGREREARLIVRQRFRWHGESLKGRRIVLLDDVATTGATLEKCAATVRAAGGTVTEAFAVATVL
jgi:predicted amidophosphoribosyltransferase